MLDIKDKVTEIIIILNKPTCFAIWLTDIRPIARPNEKKDIETLQGRLI